MNDPRYDFLRHALFDVDDRSYVPSREPCIVIRASDLGAIHAISGLLDGIAAEAVERTMPPLSKSRSVDRAVERMRAFTAWRLKHDALHHQAASDQVP